MRWRTQKVQRPGIRDRRARRVFLLFPLTLDEETRWLERATIIEIYRGHGYWCPLHWVEKDLEGL